MDFKVGDRVKITASNYPEDLPQGVGAIYTISAIDYLRNNFGLKESFRSKNFFSLASNTLELAYPKLTVNFDV